jgi:signal transduction histidine kinase
MAGQSLRVLLVEDSTADAGLIAAYLAEAGRGAFTISRASRLEAALPRLGAVDVVLLDLSLPDSPPESTLRAARIHSSEVPIVILTGTDDEDLAREAVQAGVQDYLTKDEISPRALQRSIRYAVDRHRSRQQEQMLRERIQGAREQALTTLIRGLAHDFNNMLSVITGNLETAQAELPPNRYLRDAKQAADLVCGLIAELVQLTTRGEARLVPVNIGEVVDETVGVISAGLDPRIEVDRADDSDHAIVLGDRTQLSRMMLNLLVNAADAVLERVDHEGDGYHPWISVALRPLDRPAEGGHRIELIVADNGAGMPEAVIERIFDPFFTTKENNGGTRRRGTGLGLATVAHVLREHGGTVDVDSRPGEGSRFRITLPMDDPGRHGGPRSRGREPSARGAPSPLVAASTPPGAGAAATLAPWG